MRIIIFFVLALAFQSLAYAQGLIQQVGFHHTFPLPAFGVWYYVDDTGREYALVCTYAALQIVDLQDPAKPDLLFEIPGEQAYLREVREWNGFAYVNYGSETENGITIVDLRQLPDTLTSKVWNAGGKIRGAHHLQTGDGYLYLFNAYLDNTLPGATIVSLADPWNPEIVYNFPSTPQFHHGIILGDTLWANGENAGMFAFDITDKTNPVKIAEQPTPEQNSNNFGISADKKTIFNSDYSVIDPGFVSAFDISNLEDITLLDTYKPSIYEVLIGVNNAHVLDDYLYVCNDRYFSIADAKRPDNIIELEIYDFGNADVWDIIPFLPSRHFMCTRFGSTGGMGIFKADLHRAALLEGKISNALTGLPIPGAKVTVMNTPEFDDSSADGQYKTGAANAGLYTIIASKEGFAPKTIPDVALFTDSITILDIELTPGSGAFENPYSGKICAAPTLFVDRVEAQIAQEIYGEFEGGQAVLFDVKGMPVRKQIIRTPQIQFEGLTQLPAGAYTLGFYGILGIPFFIPIMK